jgi:hypothetical protein
MIRHSRHLSARILKKRLGGYTTALGAKGRKRHKESGWFKQSRRGSLGAAAGRIASCLEKRGSYADGKTSISSGREVARNRREDAPVSGWFAANHVTQTLPRGQAQRGAWPGRTNREKRRWPRRKFHDTGAP